MTEDVLVSVRGFHQIDGPQRDEVEVFAPGKYYFKNGKHYILYDEVVEDTRETVKNRITLRDGRMEVRKKGPIVTSMTFDRGQKNSSWYNTPVGPLYTGISVKDMQVKEQENLLEIKVEYELEVNYEHVADSQIVIRVMTKDSGLFRLR